MFTDILKYINWKNSLFRFCVFLAFFMTAAFLDLVLPTKNISEKNDYLLKMVVTFTTGIGIYYIVRYGFGIIQSNPLNSFVSTAIVFLLIHPTNSIWYFILAVVAIAMGKLLVRKNNMPVLNPAAFSLFLTYLVSMVANSLNGADTLLISWWGADMFQNITSTIPVLNILIPLVFLFGFVYFAHAFKKLPYSGSFFVVYSLLLFAFTLSQSSLSQAVDMVYTMLFNATAFCALVMLPEPKTSPIFFNQQIIVGGLAGMTLFILNTWFGWMPVDTLVNTILIANIFTLIGKSIPRKPAVPIVQTTITMSQGPTTQTTEFTA